MDNLSFLIAAGIFEAHLLITDEAAEEMALRKSFAVWRFQDEQNPKSIEFDSLYDSAREFVVKRRLFCGHVFGRGGLNAGAGDAVVPAQSMRIEEAPEIAEPDGNGREKRGEHTPTARAAVEGRAVKGSQAQTGSAEARGGAGIHNKKKLIDRPEGSGDGADRADEQRERSAKSGKAGMQSRIQAGVQAQKNCAEGAERYGENESIDKGGEGALRYRGRRG